MLYQYLRSGAARELATAARAAASGRAALFHGTRMPHRVIASGVLRASARPAAVSLTRSPDVAAYWAVLPRDKPDEVPAVLVLDRNALRCRFHLEPYHDFVEPAVGLLDEMEERIWDRNIFNLRRYVIGVALLPGTAQVPERWRIPPIRSPSSASPAVTG